MHMQNFSLSPVDHFIQADILSQLYAVSDQVFSDLKAGDIDNGLFMYHMRKLINRGVVEKSDQGFRLTDKGIRWINFVGPSTLHPRPLPRLLINFIVTNPARTHVLLSRRKGPSAVLLNMYLFPGGLHPYGVSDQDAVRFILHEMNLPQDSKTAYLTLAEKLVHADDGYVHHSLSILHALELEMTVQPATEHFALEWLSIIDVLQDSSEEYEQSLKTLLKSYLDGNMPARIAFKE